MNLEFEERDTELLEFWQKIVKNEIQSLAIEIDKVGVISESVLSILRKAELLKPFLPKELGGEGKGLFSLTLMLEEFGKVSPSLAFFIENQVILGIRATHKHSNHPEKDKMVIEASEFKFIVALAATEVSAGADLSLIESKSTLENEKVKISGEKSFVNWASKSDGILTLTKNTEGEINNVSLTFVPINSPGVQIFQPISTMGMRGLEPSPVCLTDTTIGKEWLFGVYGYGMDIFNRIMKELRIGTAAISVGIAQGAFNESSQFAKTRKQFGKPVGSFQSLQWRFSDAAMKIDASRLHVWRAAQEASEKTFFGTNSALAKLYATESACWVTDFSAHVMGSKGYVQGGLSERLLRDARFLRICHGSSEILKNLIAESL
ncbi:MAG: acyl-CoA/acyl-ACP dehydrogenase [Candidatus Riflebacteria bacterium]|nr:acyl-CoA/acyl-ACP dehydrogenase [Candidatus Riflebacteria bacterium]